MNDSLIAYEFNDVMARAMHDEHRYTLMDVYYMTFKPYQAILIGFNEPVISRSVEPGLYVSHATITT